MERLSWNVTAGQSVALTAGSRGIRHILPVTCGVVDHFRKLGLKPFLVPAMGSHGGATADGQKKLLADYGLTESAAGCPIHSSMETVLLGNLAVEQAGNIPIHFDKTAYQADHLFLLNRIKSHTRFSGPIESGLLKMLMIGLGKAEGAGVYHRAVAGDRFSRVIIHVADYLMSRISLLGGLGIVENGEGNTAVIEAFHAQEIPAGEERLLKRSKELMPGIPFEEIDLLFIRRIGKNISGTGFDSNVVGRKFDDHKATRGEKPVVRCIAVCSLTPETDGNANGIGMAEFCLSSVLEQVDWPKTRLNAITANHVSAAMLPLDYPTEEEIMEAAWQTLGRPDWPEFRVLWIDDTLHLEEMTASESLRREVERNKNCTIP
ncbi:MAG: [Fe-S]-binding protein [Planctomycetaceae bacterium]|nr:[Fe-S]-binding protein [Planctomycetaceae bacterium]